MKIKHKIPAVVMNPCINGLGVARALGLNGVDVIGISDGKQLPGLDSRYFKEFWYCDKGVNAILDMLIEKGRHFSTKFV